MSWSVLLCQHRAQMFSSHWLQYYQLTMSSHRKTNILSGSSLQNVSALLSQILIIKIMSHDWFFVKIYVRNTSHQNDRTKTTHQEKFGSAINGIEEWVKINANWTTQKAGVSFQNSFRVENFKFCSCRKIGFSTIIHLNLKLM